MSDKDITIEVNGVEMPARAGQMVIEVTDAADVYVPRFCYHSKLSVAANCRMCLIEVENVPKPLPACATPVTDGMKVFTKSAKAIDAQKSVMEFLLINHPLDCPICDQGGECELQDIAMGFGRGVSRYTERKRVVKDKDLGPLVSTDMTRCIHCTRCVRFGEEIAGIQELGTIGRGEQTEIRAFIESSVDHELSGNIIDLCPVGALNNKPYRFAARAWEMVQHPTIAPHDCVGSNIYAHVMDGVVKRVVPALNESINENWASDRDRFSYEGIYADDRLQRPVVRDDGEWRQCSWDEALDVAAAGLQKLGGDLGAWLSPNATTEEAYLFTRLIRHLGSDSIDYRLRQQDFRQQDSDPVFPYLGLPIADIDGLDAALVIGSNLRKEVPMLAHRLRKAATNGARVSFVNSERFEYLFPVAHHRAVDDIQAELVQLVIAAAGGIENLDGPARSLVSGAASAAEAAVSRSLSDAASSAVFLGQMAMRHPRYAEIRLLALELARLTDSRLGYLPEGANAAGISLAGGLPHRAVGGAALNRSGATIADMLRKPPRGLVLLGVEPEADIGTHADADAALEKVDFVLALSPYLSDGLHRRADVILPIGTFAETSGTFVNAAGTWQSFAGVANPVGESRPAWKVLRVLGNLTGLPDCDYASSGFVRDELRAQLDDVAPDTLVMPDAAPGSPAGGSTSGLDVPMYRIDPLVRRAKALQQTAEARRADPAGSGSGVPEVA